MSVDDNTNYYEPNAEKKFDYLSYISGHLLDLAKLNFLLITAIIAVVPIVIKYTPISEFQISSSWFMILGVISWISTFWLIAFSFMYLDMVFPTHRPPFMPKPYKQFDQRPLTPETLYMKSVVLKLILFMTILSIYLFFIGILDAWLETQFQGSLSIVFGLTISWVIILTIISMVVLSTLFILIRETMFDIVKNTIHSYFYKILVGYHSYTNSLNRGYHELEIFEYWVLEYLEENEGRTINDISDDLWGDNERVRQDIESLIDDSMMYKVDNKYLYITRRGYANLKLFYYD
jgi:hypothetical protein